MFLCRHQREKTRFSVKSVLQFGEEKSFKIQCELDKLQK